MMTMRNFAPLASSIARSSGGVSVPPLRPPTMASPAGLPCEVSTTASTSLLVSIAEAADRRLAAKADGVALPPGRNYLAHAQTVRSWGAQEAHRVPRQANPATRPRIFGTPAMMPRSSAKPPRKRRGTAGRVMSALRFPQAEEAGLSSASLARTTPALLGLYALVALAADDMHRKRKLAVRSAGCTTRRD